MSFYVWRNYKDPFPLKMYHYLIYKCNSLLYYFDHFLTDSVPRNCLRTTGSVLFRHVRLPKDFSSNSVIHYAELVEERNNCSSTPITMSSIRVQLWDWATKDIRLSLRKVKSRMIKSGSLLQLSEIYRNVCFGTIVRKLR